MFTDEQIKYMQSLGLGFDYSNLSDDNLLKIEDVVSDRLLTHCLDENYEPSPEGRMCEDILYALAQ